MLESKASGSALEFCAQFVLCHPPTFGKPEEYRAFAFGLKEICKRSLCGNESSAAIRRHGFHCQNGAGVVVVGHVDPTCIAKFGKPGLYGGANLCAGPNGRLDTFEILCLTSTCEQDEGACRERQADPRGAMLSAHPRAWRSPPRYQDVV